MPQAVTTLLRPLAEAHGVCVCLECAEAPTVSTDRTQLEQALVNVGKNAIEPAGLRQRDSAMCLYAAIVRGRAS